MAEQGRFLNGPTMGHVVRMTLTGAVGITFVFGVQPLALFMAGRFGPEGVIYAQAAVGALVGVGAAWWGWYYVTCLSRSTLPALDLVPPHPYANADRFRRR